MDKTIYIDTPTQYNSKGKFSHMMCQDLEVLHTFAVGLNIKKGWFENKKGHMRPHYDVKIAHYDRAIEEGAVALTLREYSKKAAELFGEYPWMRDK